MIDADFGNYDDGGVVRRQRKVEGEKRGGGERAFWNDRMDLEGWWSTVSQICRGFSRLQYSGGRRMRERPR